jgi:pimeloyl-ACP methyl ester carboxylesterase
LLHGFALTSAVFWRPLISHFQGYYRIIAFDLLGHGDSDAPPHGYKVDNQAELIASALESLNVSRAVFIGHSMGGIIAAQLAIDSPSRVHKLVLFDSPLPDGSLRHLRHLLRNAPLSAKLPMSLLLLPGAGAISKLTPYALRRLYTKFAFTQLRVVYHPTLLTDELLDQGVRNSGAALIRDVHDVVIKADIISDLRRLQVMTLLVAGDHDLLLPIPDAKQFHDLIVGSKLAVIGQAGHYSLLDNPAEFNTALEDFLRSPGS